VQSPPPEDADRHDEGHADQSDDAAVRHQHGQQAEHSGCAGVTKHPRKEVAGEPSQVDQQERQKRWPGLRHDELVRL
jgi:hypothetical protein